MSTDSMARPVNSPSTGANLDAAHADVKAEIARTDAKVSLLLAFTGALLAGVWTIGSGRRLPLAAEVLGGVGVALLAVVAGVLLRAARPNLGGARPVGFPRWATLSADELRAELAGDDRPQHILELSRIAVAKFVHLRRAIDLTCVAGGLLIAAFVVAVAGGAR